MRPTDQLLIGIVSGEASLIVALVAWVARATTRQVAQTAQDLEHLANLVERHLAWHDGLDDRNAWRGKGP